jgi:protein-S-isoprenylcysteine O-methyltransferase Ste14
MIQKKFKDILFLLLAIIFSIALMFAFIELPRLFDLLLQENIGFPGFDQGIGEVNAYKTDLYINALYLRWIGYACLILVAVFIFLGFLTKKTGWAWVGAFTLFLPVFGQFALSMFFLAGLGILRVGWLPFMDISFKVLELGNIIYVPYWILMWFFRLFGWNAHLFLCYFFLGCGTLLFVWGVLVWIQTRFSEEAVATQWIYRFSRHPQYLGWIIWSYGLILYSPLINQLKRSWTMPSSLPWLLATMVIIAICLLEEIRMKESDKEKYERYHIKTPFLFPIPNWLKIVLKAPMKLIFGKDQPEKKSEVAWITSAYTGIFILLSLFWIDFSQDQLQVKEIITNPKYKIDSLVNEIKKPQHRRYIHTHFDAMKRLENIAINPLIKLLTDSNAVIREFAADALGDIKSVEAIKPLILTLNDSISRVRNSASRAIELVGSKEAEQPLFEMLQKTKNQNLRSKIYQVLGNLGSEKAWSYLINELENPVWYHRTATLNALNNINPDKSWQYIISALKDENANVRRYAVTIILQQKPKEAKEALKEVLNDEDFETRFYAKQALNLIENER